jgi:hypothetical protein
MPADGFVQVGSAGHRGAADAIGPAALTLKRTDGSVTHQDSAFSEAEAAQDALAGLATLLRGWALPNGTATAFCGSIRGASPGASPRSVLLSTM